jgi:uncharacterized iron-regulated protein
MFKLKLLLIATLVALFSFQNSNPAYKLYDGKGKESDWKQLLKETENAEVVFFGEYHDNSINHWLQLRMLKELNKQKNGKVAVGAEMFEADNQLVIDEYLRGTIKESHLETEAKIWKNHKTDYKPIVNYCKENKLPFIATNIPRRYANVVSREGMAGLEKLDAEAKRYIATLPIYFDKEIPGYKRMIEEMGGGHNTGMNMEFLAQAQASKDATMAHFILKNKKEGSTFYHINGAYHSDNYDGIVYYLKRMKPGIKIVTISIADQEDLSKLEEEHKSKADFIFALPSDMIKTH